MACANHESDLTAEQRSGAVPPSPGQIVEHASGPDTGPDVGFEVGLYPGASIYIGQVADETLGEGVVQPNPKPWWFFLRDSHRDEFMPVGTAVSDRIVVEKVVLAIRRGIRAAEVRDGFATSDAEARWIADTKAGVYDTDMPASVDWGKIARANADDTGMMGGGPIPPEALTTLPLYATVAAAAGARGPIRDVLWAIRGDVATNGGALADRLVAVLADLQAIIDSAASGEKGGAA